MNAAVIFPRRLKIRAVLRRCGANLSCAFACYKNSIGFFIKPAAGATGVCSDCTASAKEAVDLLLHGVQLLVQFGHRGFKLRNALFVRR